MIKKIVLFLFVFSITVHGYGEDHRERRVKRTKVERLQKKMMRAYAKIGEMQVAHEELCRRLKNFERFVKNSPCDVNGGCMWACFCNEQETEVIDGHSVPKDETPREKKSHVKE